MGAGRIITGFSKPYVAKYAANGGTITYTDGQILSQGVNVTGSASTSDNNDFYADNVISESEAGVFTSGELSLTVKGIEIDAERLIMGLPAADTNGLTAYGDDQVIPEVGVGFVVRYMKDGVTTYAPYIFPRCQFAAFDVAAATQEENIDWQTTELSATIKRAEDAKRNWKYVGDGVATEAAAEDVIKTFFGIK